MEPRPSHNRSPDAEAQASGPAPPAPPELSALRARIDDLDAKIVALLNERAQVVSDVGRVKRDDGTPIYAPHREAAVLSKVLGQNAGPLPERTLEAIYRELMSGSFAIEQPLRIGYLGPPGSFSHVAAMAHFGASVEFGDTGTIAGVFDEVRRGRADYGLAPIENSTGGSIAETLDAFKDGEDKVRVYAEALVTIRHNLLSNCAAGTIKRVYSKPEIFLQCRKFLSAEMPEAQLIPSASSSRAAQEAFEAAQADPQCGAAAIGSSLAGRLYGLNTLYEDVEDNPNNITRFLIISRQEAEVSGKDKTSILFTTAHTPGSLVRVLQCFDRGGINLAHIDKRPSGRENWKYSFYIEAEGHRSDPRMVDAIELARRDCESLSVLGSYPAAQRIL